MSNINHLIAQGVTPVDVAGSMARGMQVAGMREDRNYLREQRGMERQKYDMDMQAAQQKQGMEMDKAAQDEIIDAGLALASMPEQERPGAYGYIVPGLKRKHPRLAAEIPDQYSPELLRQIGLGNISPEQAARALMERRGIKGMEAPEPKVVGNSLVDPRTGKPIYTDPQRPQNPTDRERDFKFYQGLNPQQRGEYDRLYGKSEGFSVTAPDGTVVQMGGKGGMKMSDQQSKDLVYFTRGQSALQNLEANATALEDFSESTTSGIPVIGNATTSPQFQAGQQAAREFLAAILRKDTGAAITNQEMEIYGKTYLPQPFDSPAVRDQKKQARRTALDAIKSGLGQAQVMAPGAPQQAGQPSIDDLVKKYQ